MTKKRKKLTQKDYDRMWGEDGPYSQVRLCEETRILDDSISRVFLVVEAEINPFTFECIKKHRRQFASDEAVIQLLEHAEYRGEKFGYVVAAGEAELCDEESKLFIRKQADTAIQTVIRMHAFVIEKYELRHGRNYGVNEKCGLSKDSEFGVLEEKTFGGQRFVWDGWMGRTVPAADELWDNKTLVGSPAGIRDNKMRFFIVLAMEENFDFRKETAIALAEILKKIAEDFQVNIENCESFSRHMLITTLLPFDIAPADFIEAVLDAYNGIRKKPLFKKDYLVTNVKKPAPEEIEVFLRQAPLDGDV